MRESLSACGLDLFKFARELEKPGIGELVINSIDNDGVIKAYDYALAGKIRETVRDRLFRGLRSTIRE